MIPSLERLPVRGPWFAAPRRLSCDLNRLTITLHTVQSPAAYAHLHEDGVLRGDPAFADADFAAAYAWMSERMEDRLETRAPGILWAWANIKRRDLVAMLRHARGDVLLTLRVRRDVALLSDFDLWHLVLNRGLLVPETPGDNSAVAANRIGAAMDAFDDRVEEVGCLNKPVSEWPDDLRREIQSSWDGIFGAAGWAASATVQATLHEIRSDDVVRAVRVR